MAARTAAFTALGGALFGLDVGYISGVQEMPEFHDDFTRSHEQSRSTKK